MGEQRHGVSKGQVLAATVNCAFVAGEVTASQTPADTSSASAASTGETASECDAPTSASRDESEPSWWARHLTRLFGTDLTLIPGIGESTALTLFAEIGADLSRFPRCCALCILVECLPHNKDNWRQDHQFTHWTFRDMIRSCG